MANNNGSNPYGIDPEIYKDIQSKAAKEATYYAGGTSTGNGMKINDVTYSKALDRMVERERARSGASALNTGSASGQDSFSGIADPEVFSALKSKLSGMLAGTDADTNLAKQQKQESIGKYDQLLADYSKQGAFTDAAALMQQNLNSAMEANKPAIQRAMEGSGTSAGSMQALLSQQLSDKASLSAGALGAEQARAYGQISAQLMGGRGQLTQGRDSGVADIVGIADLLKVNKGSAYGNFDPASMLNAEANMLKAQSAADSVGGVTKKWSTYGPDPVNQWMTQPGSLEDQFRTGKKNPLDPANNYLYGSNGTY